MKSLRNVSKLMLILITISLVLAGSAGSSQAIRDQDVTTGSTADYFADLVVGVPGENIPGSSTIYLDAGMVNVIYGLPQGLAAQDNDTFNQDMDGSADEVEEGDAFGNTLASGDFNGDGNYDVAIGVPSEDIVDGATTEQSAGAVHVLYGSDDGGLTSVGNQFYHQDSLNVVGSAEYNDQFGRALAVGNFNGDAYDDLAIGVPYEDFEYFETIVNGGAVVVIYGSAGGLSPTAVLDDQMWHQDRSQPPHNIIDGVEAYDWFGFSLAAGDFDSDDYDDLAIGAPGEDSSVKDDMGVVQIIYGTSSGLTAAGNQQWEQYDWGGASESEDYDHFGWSLAVGDFKAHGYDDLAIGVPGEDIEGPSTVVNAGAVNILYGSSSGLDDENVEFLYQDGAYIEEQAEYNDQFGYTLATVNFGGSGVDDLVVGVPFENLGDPLVTDAGAVHVVIHQFGTGWVSGNGRYFHQDRDNIPDELETGDNFGLSLAPGDFNGDGKEDLAIGVPYDSCNVSGDGSVVVVYDDYWPSPGYPPQRWCQGGDLADYREPEDHFGYALVALPSSGALPYRVFLPMCVSED